MEIIPAVDLKGRRCVRLLQGLADRETVYSDDPVAVARRWFELGARRLHVVDLDGAFEGAPRQLDIVARIAAEVGCPVECGGGFRTDEAIAQALDAGIDRVVVGTRALSSPDWLRQVARKHPGRIVAGIDARDGKVAVKGWTEVSELDALELGRVVADCGVRAIIFTDIARDGMLTGPNVEAVCRMAEAVAVPVIASGGVGSHDDVRALAALPIEGMIIGKALYDGRVDLPEALRIVSG
jgi:phosphoribosylformimino-5-aminoimidazole carboxamide ribotide isomerase